MKKLLNILKTNKVIVTLVLIALVFVYFIFLRDKTPEIAVRQVQLQNRTVTKTVSNSGFIKSNNDADLSFQTLGKIQKIYVNEGDTVEKGKLLAQLDNQSLVQTVNAYRDARDIALRTRDLFVHDMYSNIKSLGGETEYNIKLRQYNEQVDQAESNYLAQQALLRNTYIYAPFSGTILDITKTEGETATASEMIVKLADLDNIVFEIMVDQEDYGMLKNDQEVEITLDSYGNKKFKGNIVDLPKYIQNNESSFAVKIRVEQEDNYNMLLGMKGDAYVVLASTNQDVPSLEYDQVYYDTSKNPYIWTVREEVLYKQPIEIGLEGDIYTEVKSQIDGPIVVPVKDSDKLSEGYKAKIVNPQK